MVNLQRRFPGIFDFGKIKEYAKAVNLQIFIYTENITPTVFSYIVDDEDQEKINKKESVDYLKYIDYMQKNFNSMDTNVPMYFAR